MKHLILITLASILTTTAFADIACIGKMSGYPAKLILKATKDKSVYNASLKVSYQKITGKLYVTVQETNLLKLVGVTKSNEGDFKMSVLILSEDMKAESKALVTISEDTEQTVKSSMKCSYFNMPF